QRRVLAQLVDVRPARPRAVTGCGTANPPLADQIPRDARTESGIVPSSLSHAHLLLPGDRRKSPPGRATGAVLTPHGPPLVAGAQSGRGGGLPSRARPSVSRSRRCPPRVRIDVSFPALAQRVTVLGSTRNIVATSAGVSNGSASGVRADICTASPPGPVRDPASLISVLVTEPAVMSFMAY